MDIQMRELYNKTEESKLCRKFKVASTSLWLVFNV